MAIKPINQINIKWLPRLSHLKLMICEAVPGMGLAPTGPTVLAPTMGLTPSGPTGL